MSLKNGKIIKCDFCKHNIYLSFQRLNRVEKHFCNRICFGKWKSIYFKGKNNPNYGNHVLSKKYKGKGNPSYIDGRSYKNYTKDFTCSLKRKIKQRDNYICQNCNMTEQEHFKKYFRALEVHHIDYNKKNCIETNLITLCKGCNIKVNKNRKYWKKYFIKKLLKGGKLIWQQQ